MIIATDDVDIKKVVNMSGDSDKLCTYVKSLVPERYRHIDAIYHNTRYYINLLVLKSDDISLEKKSALSKLLTRNIRVVGYMGVYITCKDLERKISMKKVNKYHEEVEHGKSSKFSSANS